jgi:hypothetical protein
LLTLWALSNVGEASGGFIEFDLAFIGDLPIDGVASIVGVLLVVFVIEEEGGLDLNFTL